MSANGNDPLDPEAITIELRTASRQLAASAARLGVVNKEYNGTVDASGAFVRGPGREYDLAVAVRAVGLYHAAVARQEKPAGEDARHSIAEVELRLENPALAADYDRLTSERTALKEFISAQRQVISGHQSVLSASKVLSGLSS